MRRFRDSTRSFAADSIIGPEPLAKPPADLDTVQLRLLFSILYQRLSCVVKHRSPQDISGTPVRGLLDYHLVPSC